MRQIKKSPIASIVKLDQEIERKGAPETGDEATRRWDRFDGKDELSQRLFELQFGLCCYTELNLTDFALENQMGFHIEHEMPKSKYPLKTFDFSNLLLSALSSEDLQQFSGQLQFGGHFKGNDFDPEKFISPHLTNSRDYFVYSSSDGKVRPNLSLAESEQQKAQYTIDLLNLNAPFLKAERQLWLLEIEECLNPLVDSSDLEVIKLIAEIELVPFQRYDSHQIRKCNQLRKFHSAVRAVFGWQGEQVIQEHYSSL